MPGKMSGGQGEVFLLKQYKEQICVKVFDLDETDKTYPYIMKKRAKKCTERTPDISQYVSSRQ